jgi:hypothetical protein
MVKQIGQSNDAWVNQFGQGNDAQLTQDGQGNEAWINQQGTNLSITEVTGMDNDVYHTQYGNDGDNSNPADAEGYNYANTKITGDNNLVETEQEGENRGPGYAWNRVEGDDNVAYTEQDGYNNMATTDQLSDNNYARVVQDAWSGGDKIYDDNEAHGNYSYIYQRWGDGNHAEAIQYGDENSSEILQLGSNNTAIVDQGIWDRSSRYPSMDNHGSSNSSFIQQSGDWNVANVLQNGDGNSSTIMQSN